MLIGMSSIQYEINNLKSVPNILLSGSRGCFIAGTQILMKDFSWRSIEEIKEGDDILGFDEKGYKYLKPTKVVSTMIRKASELVTVQSDCNSVTTTPEHPFLALKGTYAKKSATALWVKADKLKSGDSLPSFSISERNTEWKQGWVLGILCSDGTISKQPYCIHLYNKNKVILDAYTQYLKELFNIVPSPIIKENGVTQLSFNNKVIHLLLHIWEDSVLKGDTKVFGKDFLRGFIGGFYDGDGSAGKKHSLDFANTNLKYLKFIEIICKGLKFNTYWNPKKSKPHKIRGYIRKKKMYLLQVYDFIQFFTVFQPLTKHIYTCLRKTKKQQIDFSHKYSYRKNKDLQETVYNLETTSGTYIANGFPVHNCGKTASAEHLAIARGKKLIILTGHTLTVKELQQVLLNLKGGEIILIDEIHSLPVKTEEVLYLPMERKYLSLQTLTGENVVVNLPEFSIIGTTTRSSDISRPLRDRFQLHFIIPHYSKRNLARIVKNTYPEFTIKECLKIVINIITPREGLNLAYRVSNLKMGVDRGLEFIGYLKGLSSFERSYLKLLQERQRLSMTSLTFTLQLDKSEVMRIEDKLINLDYIEIKSNGRFLTDKGSKYIKEIL